MSKGKILFQLTGSIACFKACQLLSRLVQAGYEVEVVASRAALKFVGEATLEGLTGRPVKTDVFAAGSYMDHIHLARWADLLLLCPASANSINKLAAGIGDDLISTLFLAHDFKRPYLIAPAMNASMLAHPATQASLERLRSWNVQVLSSPAGALACGENGDGRLLEPDAIFSALETAIETALAPKENGLKILVTAGGTREPIDGVRSITNSSTGRTGAALAARFRQQGHAVTLLHAPSSFAAALTEKPGVRTREFITFDDLQNLLQEELAAHAYDAVVHAAAVSDFTLSQVTTANGHVVRRGEKIESAGGVTFQLEPNPKLVDHLREYSCHPMIQVVAFKLTDSVDENVRLNAVTKLATHARPDFIVHNDAHELAKGQADDAHHCRIFAANSDKVVAKIETNTQLADKLAELMLSKRQPRPTNQEAAP